MIHGKNFIAGTLSSEGTKTFSISKPACGTELEGNFVHATSAELNTACAKAAEAAPILRQLSGKKKAEFLRTIADNILNLGDTLITRACAESALPEGRITGERGRTMGQLHMFADLVEEGSWIDARVDPAMPDRQPMPRTDLRMMRRALGPVAVFGASNFPLAFSTAGGDTASALAAGCPVVFKAHSFHPGTSELVAGAVTEAVKTCGLPEGTFSLVFGAGSILGQELIQHPDITAVGFTGSYGAGRAIYEACAKRPTPIPVFAELGANNPQFVLPSALVDRSQALAEGLASSVVMGAGQFCTNPGMTVLIDNAQGREFAKQLSEALGAQATGTAVACGIATAYDSALATKIATGDVEVLAQAQKDTQNKAGMTPALIATTSDTYAANPSLAHEIFGPSTLIIWAKDEADLVTFAENLEGQLTSTIHGESTDLELQRTLLDILETKAGRVIINQFPTGVEVCHAMLHGGPWPASTTHTTSVGSSAITRFTRHVCYQNTPEALLPAELQEANPLGIMRLYDGTYTR